MQNNFLSILFYVAQVGLLGYVVLYQIWWAGGYQKQGTFSGAVNVKVKGAGYLGDYATCGTAPSHAQWWVSSCSNVETKNTKHQGALCPPSTRGGLTFALLCRALVPCFSLAPSPPPNHRQA